MSTDTAAVGKKGGRLVDDEELVAMHEVLAVLEDLKKPSARRVLQWAWSRWGEEHRRDVLDADDVVPF